LKVACFEAAIQSVVKVTQRKSKQKWPIKIKKRRERADNPNVSHRKPVPKPSVGRDQWDRRRERRRRSREADPIPEVKATQRKSKQKGKKRRELYDGDIADPVMLMPVCLVAVKMKMVAKRQRRSHFPSGKKHEVRVVSWGRCAKESKRSR
jgi:hypothetical protein